MREKLIDLSGKIDHLRLEAIDSIANVAASLEIPFFIIGAFARDLLLQQGHDIAIYRGTIDIDIGVKVSNWDKYGKLKKGLLETKKFIFTNEEQRLKYKNNLMIDLIPFGAISDNSHNIRWPSQETVICILGFEESFQHTQIVRLRSKPVLDVKIVTLAGLTIMKMLSWKDKYPERLKDAGDLLLIIRSYTDASNFERILNEMPDLLESDDFDYIGAGARLLGRDIANTLTPETKKEILKILNKETGEQDRYRLIEDMMRSDSGKGIDFENILRLLEELKTGIHDSVS